MNKNQIKLLELLPPKAAALYREALEEGELKARGNLLRDAQDALLDETPSGKLYGPEGPLTLLQRELVAVLDEQQGRGRA